MYNLTNQQRETLRWIVQKVREGALAENFSFVHLANGDIRFFGKGVGSGISDHPMITEGIMSALMKADLILVNTSEKGFVHCTLLGKAYEAIDSNFNDIEVGGHIIMADSMFNTPNPNYIYDLFVLMPFDAALKPIYDNHIRKVAVTLGLSIARADDFFSQNSIIQEIWSAILQSSILIADCTEKNPNVFYEIGLAHAIRKPVILITQNPDDVPFDLRYIRYIQYAYTPPGMEKFEKDLSLTIIETKKAIPMSDK